jgi:hypothetical protein
VSKAASKPALEELHDALAKVLKEAVTETELKVIELPEGTKLADGTDAAAGTKIVVRTRNAALLGQARQFLKDNNIECAPGFPSKPVKELAEGLPFPAHPGGDDEDDPALRR